MVPDGWVKAKYSDGIQLLSGQHINACEANERGDGTPYLTGPADFPNGRIEVTKYTSKPKTVCKAGDILLTVKGSGTGKSIIADSCYCISRQLMAIRAIKFDPAFTYYSITSLTNSFERAAAGLIPGISRSDVLNSIILLPPLPEQKKIARILSTWDKAIETVDKLIENSKQQKKALMQQLLTGKKRLPGFSGEWKEVRLNELFKPVTRKNTKNISLVLTVSGENGLVDQTTYFNRKVAADCLDGYYHLKNGEFAYNRSAMKGYPFGAIKRLEQHEDGVLSTLYMCFKLKSTTNSGDFYRHYFEHGLANKELYKVVQVGARAHGLLNISKGDFFDIKILCPPEDEQKAIADALNAMDTLLNKEKRQRKALLCQRQALMQQLLTGKRRVTIEE